MREIKFRAWDKGNECMIDPNYANISLNGQDLGILDQVYKDEFEIVNKNDFVLEQYTGLKDITNTDIYEGDIVRAVDKVPGDPDEMIGIVVYEEGTYYVDNGKTGVSLWSETMQMSVVGNIHENSELLEDDDDE